MVEITDSGELSLEANVPPKRVEEEIEQWRETYSVDSLVELSLDDIEGQSLLFENDVMRLKSEYNPGRLVTPIMQKVWGKEPLPQEQAREVRGHIDSSADEIRRNFRKAKGRVEKREREKKRRFIGNILESINGILTSTVKLMRTILPLK